MADVHSTGASSTYGRALAQTRPGSPSPIPPLPFPQRASSWSSTPESPRRLKVTGWRLLNTGVILRLGIYKAVATYFGQTTAPSTLDWVIGVVWTLISYWVGFIEQDHPTYAEWFFQEDLSDGLWKGPVAILVLFAAGGGFWAAKFVGREEDRLVIALLKILGVYFGAAMMLVALSGLVFIVLALLWSEFANFFDRPPAVRRSNWSPNRPLIIFIYFILVILWIIISECLLLRVLQLTLTPARSVCPRWTGSCQVDALVGHR
ncbi:hypothetical protein B0H17DRAFT_2661 [Mycena rosella]|uniref:Uncharacterized protein n=1 Tax=Mycena rosella TaxID=1033263 RepID=A0AAD7H2R0_MYCRO|nr:hypothetical protein B0H17DRAFT_2661 [Mycena rosella]